MARRSYSETAPLDPPQTTRLALHFIDEPGRAPVPVDRALRIGRDDDCEVRIDHDSVSRVHAWVDPGDPPTVRDAGSRNGTFVAGERLTEEEWAPLAAGATLRIGQALLLVDHERAPQRVPVVEDPERVDEGPMAAVYELAERLAADDITVLLTGETGVGKEVIAHWLHARSPRRAGPFVPVHAAALTVSLFESELFGYERGAFTGAEGERAGLFELANGGTLFFDEIGELPLDMQPKLLRVLEDRRITRVGGRTLRPVDVRIIAATNRDLASEVACGAFRSDLYFRLNGFALAIPPLRERRVEIAALARALLERACAERRRSVPRISPAALERLEKHDWPGNVRELRNVLTRMLLLAPPGVQELGENEVARALVEPLARRDDGDEDGERTRILDALARSGGNQAEAAAALGIARRTLLYKLDRLGIPRPRKRRR